MRPLFESCVDSVAAAVASAEGGAGRLELCARLDLGGTTPDAALVAAVVAAVPIPVRVMIRPRGGLFVYDAEDRAGMRRDIARMREAGAHGVVVGALDAHGDVDGELLQSLVEAARPLPVTFHRAIDEARSLLAAIDAILGSGVDRVLTSGGRATATQGAATIASLVRCAGERLTIVAGGGVRAHNVADLIAATGVREVHAHLLSSSAAPETWVEEVRQFVSAMSLDGRG